jgi:hypothetical protein
VAEVPVQENNFKKQRVRMTFSTSRPFAANKKNIISKDLDDTLIIILSAPCTITHIQPYIISIGISPWPKHLNMSYLSWSHSSSSIEPLRSVAEHQDIVVYLLAVGVGCAPTHRMGWVPGGLDTHGWGLRATGYPLDGFRFSDIYLLPNGYLVSSGAT